LEAEKLVAELGNRPHVALFSVVSGKVVSRIPGICLAHFIDK
jgi:hypothetical protein